MTIWFASGNNHKKKELANILTASGILSGVKNVSWELKIPADAGLDFDPDETGSSFIDNALIKAAELHKLLEEKRPTFYKSGSPVIADDSGICVDALNGRPGIHSSLYGGKNLGAAERNAKLLTELGGNPLRNARFVCAMVLYFGPNRFYIAQESLEGVLVENTEAARGKGGFGYDPILYIPDLGRTVAELSDEEKNRLSHRGKAGRAIAQFLNSIS